MTRLTDYTDSWVKGIKVCDRSYVLGATPVRWNCVCSCGVECILTSQYLRTCKSPYCMSDTCTTKPTTTKPAKQSKSSTQPRIIVVDDCPMDIATASVAYDVGAALIYKRLAKGWSDNDAVKTPVKSFIKREKTYAAFNKVQTLKEWAAEYSITLSTLKHRLYTEHLSLELALSKPVRRYSIFKKSSAAGGTGLDDWHTESAVENVPVEIC